MAFPSLPPSPSSSAATWRRRSGLVALLLLLIFLSFQVVVHVPSVRSAVSRRLFSDHRHRAAREAGHRSCPGCGDLQDVEDFNKTIAYTDQDGRIKLFKVTAKEFASSSIWENPLLPRDSQPLAELKESAEEQPLATGSEANNLSSSAVSATQRPDPIKLKREVKHYFSRNFDNKVKVSYNIWRQEFHHTNTDSTVKLMKDQIIMAKCIKESKAAIGDAHMDSELDSSALERAKAMGHVLSSARDVLYNSDEVSRRLRQNTFLVQHAAKAVPMPLHCLHMQLITIIISDEEDKAKLEDRSLYHYAIFSDNVLAASVVVRSTVTNAKEPNKHVFHIVTDKLNFAAMKMWFISHSPLPATVHVENIDNFKWLNSSYCLVMRQLESARLKEFYFKAHDPSSLSDGNENLKYRNPKYLSMLNHLRFYMPEIHPKLDKILFLDDDVVVQKDLTPLWDVDLKGMVNGAVETCKESFHRFDTYLNFSHPKISENFDPRACGWAFGMNMFDLKEWKKRNITGIYHYWQNLNEDRKLWKLGTLPPGLITFYNLTHPLDHTWHVLGLGYDPAVDIAEIENAAVVHYNGNYKPWLDLAISSTRPTGPSISDSMHLLSSVTC
ncbi:hypothetical protein ZWY2020_051263 [Hordeum vulgare]|nr:hypothetical protein ZWY2020_051263 [Hordeum vulgare]